MAKLILTGNNLKIKDIGDFVSSKIAVLDISRQAIIKVQESEKFMKKGIEDGKIIYGINTGFGPMASHIISSKQSENLQQNLILSHAVGMGEPIDNDFVLAAMMIRLNTLIKGYSGVSMELINFLIK